MSDFGPPPLASIEAARPVFLIVMGVFLALVAWRLARTSTTWTARTLVAGALMLGFGYGVMMPLYEAGRIESFSAKGLYDGCASTAVAWHVVKLVVMNVGWLLFGIGVALHAKLFQSPSSRRAEIRDVAPHPRIMSPHESVASKIHQPRPAV